MRYQRSSAWALQPADALCQDEARQLSRTWTAMPLHSHDVLPLPAGCSCRMRSPPPFGVQVWPQHSRWRPEPPLLRGHPCGDHPQPPCQPTRHCRTSKSALALALAHSLVPGPSRQKGLTGVAARRGQLHRSRAQAGRPGNGVGGGSRRPASLQYAPICGEMAAPAKALHGSLLHHNLCGYWRVQSLQHTINPVPESSGMHPVCAM